MRRSAIGLMAVGSLLFLGPAKGLGAAQEDADRGRVFLVRGTGQVGTGPAGPVGTVAEQYLLRSINAERAAAGLRPVHFDRELQVAARFHAGQMARANLLSHCLEGEPDLSSRGSAAGAHFSRISENVAVGGSILSMHDALMRSEHHRENILDSQVNSVGVAVLQANGFLWAVEDFSRSVERLSLDEQEVAVTNLLLGLHLNATPTAEARSTCALSAGYVGERPTFTMRYTTSDLTRLPEQLKMRVATDRVRMAAVGACGPEKDRGGFASYNIAVVLYR